MANRVLITGTSAIFICSTGNDPAGLVLLNVDDASTLAFDIQARMQGGEDASGAQSALIDIAYYNMTVDPRTLVAKGTNVTADGLYGVVAPGMDIFITPSAGSCTVNWKVLPGPLA